MDQIEGNSVSPSFVKKKGFTTSVQGASVHSGFV